MNNLKNAIRLKAELDALRPITAEDERRILQKLRLDWNYHSNHLEGNSLTYGETKALILHGITAQGKPLKDHTEVEGHNEAVQWIYELAQDDRPLSETFIRDLHTILLVKPYKVLAEPKDGIPTWKTIQIGQYKNSNNYVLTATGERQDFLPFQETPRAMQELVDWYALEKVKPEINPILLATQFHHKFINIHPFDDGNGRVVRLLMNYILLQFGYPPIIIKTEEKTAYFSALQAATAGNIEPFFEFIINNLILSLELMIKGARGESVEDPDDLDKELALLEQKLNSQAKKVNTIKSIDSINKIINAVVLPLAEKIELNNKKFDKFYASSKCCIFKLPSFTGKTPFTNISLTDIFEMTFNDGINISVFSANIPLEKALSDNIYRYCVKTSFENFKYDPLNKISFDEYVIFIFDDDGYSIYLEISSLKSKNVDLIKKTYDDLLTQKDIENIVLCINKRHLENMKTYSDPYDIPS